MDRCNTEEGIESKLNVICKQIYNKILADIEITGQVFSDYNKIIQSVVWYTLAHSTAVWLLAG